VGQRVSPETRVGMGCSGLQVSGPPASPVLSCKFVAAKSGAAVLRVFGPTFDLTLRQEQGPARRTARNVHSG